MSASTLDEKKKGEILVNESISVESSPTRAREKDEESDSNLDLDPAARFLDANRDVDTSHVNIDKLRHRIDRHIIPIMCLCFIMQFLDKAIYNYTAVMGIKKDLNFHGQDFSTVSSGYALAHLAMQVPNAYLIQRLPASKYLSGCVLAWGIVTIFTAFVRDFPGMLTARIFLAITEATIGPSLMLITAQWYTKSEQAPRFAYWHSAPGVGQILGGILSFAFQHFKVPNMIGLSGWTWRLLYIALGIITLGVAYITFRCLPDTPMDARFMKTEEKVALLRHVSVNMTGVSNHKARPKELLEAARDPQIYLLVFPGIFASMSAGLSGTYSTTLIKNLGFSNKESALLNMPSGLVSITANMIVGFGIRRASRRWLWAVGLTLPGIVGASLLSFLKQPNLGGSLAGIWMITCIYTITTVVQQWAMANVSGHTKRAFTAAAMSACYGIGGIVAPQTFVEKDAPGYLPAKITILVTQATCAVLFFTLYQYYFWENKRRDRYSKKAVLEDDNGAEEVKLSNEEAWAGLTDRQNKSFRYVY